MITRYVFSHPEGDIPVTPVEAQRPLKMDTEKDHPFLTLGDYFQAIETVFLRHQYFFQQQGRTPIESLIIRSEKHGGLYHVVCLEVSFHLNRLKYGLLTAVSRMAKRWLVQEYETITLLNKSLNPSFLPQTFFIDRVDHRRGNQAETLKMALVEWFEDYHEWHVSMDPGSGQGYGLRLWDQKKGKRLLADHETFEIFRQASRILILYYNAESGNAISHWHHAAGDFIIQIKDDQIDVKLTAARRYEPFITPGEGIHPSVGLLYIFLDLTIRMRLDRWDGVGETVWMDDVVLKGTIRGFFDALMEKEAAGTLRVMSIRDFIELLKVFSKDEFRKMFNPLMNFYHTENLKEYVVIKENLDKHIEVLYQQIQII
ncbi:MAG: hypothetical protein JW932_11400 [Deltaproteobacteria bacterium]|nr:hypothetical protein [Deltaproteobacteria bacterium]